VGTFHDDKHDLHGITVVVDTSGPEIFVGRCDDMDENQVLLVDADVHRDGDGGRSKEEYVARAAGLGYWKKHDRLRIDRRAVTSIRRLGDL
jgi:hypothetical protein